MYTVYLALAAVLIAVAQILLWGEPVAATLLLWLLVVKVGLGGLWAFLGHYFKSDEVAAYIGWPAGNPFQKEVAFANLGLGSCGLLCYFFRDGFWLATIVFASAFLVGAFSVHLQDRRGEWQQPSRQCGAGVLCRSAGPRRLVGSVFSPVAFLVTGGSV